MIMTIILTSSIEWMIKVKLVMGLQVVMDDYPFLHTEISGVMIRKIGVDGLGHPFHLTVISGPNES